MSVVLDVATRLTERAAGSRAARVRRALVVLLAAAVLAGLGWVLLASPLLAVERVAVAGTARTTPEQVTRAAAVVVGTPLARVDVDGVRRRVGALPTVARVEVERAWPATLRLRVVERRAVAGVLAEGSVTLLDGEGVAFARARTLPGGAVRLQVPRPGSDDATTRSALAVLDELPDGLRSRLAIVRAPSPEAVSLLLRDGRKVVWGGPGRAQDKAAAALALLRLPGAVYDVRSPDVVVRQDPGVAPPTPG